MVRWTKIHPYNAGQVMRVTGRPDRERWKRAAVAAVAEAGLGRPRFRGGDAAVDFLPAEEVVVEQACGTEDGGAGEVHAAEKLEAYFNEELNRAFAAGEVPIRFCILPAPRDDRHAEAGANGTHTTEESHYLAAVYDHWIADSRAMRELMQRIFERYRSADGTTNLPRLTVEPPGGRSIAQLFRKQVGYLTRLTAMTESLRNIWRYRHGYRLNMRNPLDLGSRFVFRELPAGLIERLHRFAKARGASVNDLFIAVIAQATGLHTAADRYARRGKPMHFARRHVGVGTIVDIRNAASEKLDQVFSLYLSGYTVLMDGPEKRTADDLIREVATQTVKLKQPVRTVRGFYAFETVRFWFDVYDTPRFRATLLHKNVPVVAGISNVNMSHSWADPSRAAAPPTNGTSPTTTDPAAPRVLDYLRISPAGPLIPLVFTLTTIQGRLSLCVTYRTAAFKEPDLLKIVDDFVRRLVEVGGNCE